MCIYIYIYICFSVCFIYRTKTGFPGSGNGGGLPLFGGGEKSQ